MARRPRSQRRLFAELIAKLEPGLRSAFEAAVADLHANLDWGAMLDALARQNIEAAIEALHIDRAAFWGYAQAKTAAFAEAGATTVATISVPGAGAIGIRFDMANPGAESWIAREVGLKVTGNLVEEQIQVVRDAIGAGFQRGQHPTEIARDIAGKVANGTRQGGVLGLDSPRAARLRAITDGIKTPEGVRDLVIRHQDGSLSVRYKVNRQTEARILRAYKRGEALSPADQAISVRQYSNALLKDRADTVARTETAQSVMAGRREAWDQVLVAKNLPPEAVIKRWVHGGGVKDPRPHHVAMSGHQVRGLDAAFEFSNGARLRFACDPEGPASEVIRCTCGTDFFLDPNWGERDGL